MPIISMGRYFVGTPNIVGIVTTDDINTITNPEYFLDQTPEVLAIQNGEFEFLETDLILMFYSGGIGFFSYDFVNQTFIPGAAGADVVLPVTSGNFAIWSNDSGSLCDLLYTPCDASKNFVAMLDSASVVASNIAVFADTTGTIADSGVPVSILVPTQGVTQMDVNSLIKFDSQSQTIDGSNAVTINAQSGKIRTASLTTAGDTAYTFTFNNSFLDANSTLQLQVQYGSNTTKNVQCIINTVGSQVCTISLINNNAAALNGDFYIHFFVVS